MESRSGGSAKLTLGTSPRLPRKRSHVIMEMVTGETDATDLLRGAGGRGLIESAAIISREGGKVRATCFSMKGSDIDVIHVF